MPNGYRIFFFDNLECLRCVALPCRKTMSFIYIIVFFYHTGLVVDSYRIVYFMINTMLSNTLFTWPSKRLLANYCGIFSMLMVLICCWNIPGSINKSFRNHCRVAHFSSKNCNIKIFVSEEHLLRAVLNHFLL